MVRSLWQSILLWLTLFEAIATRKRWRGLSWSAGGGSVWWFVAVAGALLLRMWHVRIVGSLAAAPVALLAQIGLSSARNRLLTPLVRLAPGQHAGMQVERFDIPLVEGYLPALHIVPAGGAKAAVCVLHGSGCNKTFYAWRLVDTLTEAGCAVLLVDLDGHGENPRPQRFPQIVENPRAAVQWLRERYEQVGLLGVSLGGCIAAYAVAQGVAVDRLAILAAPPKLQFSRTDVWREALALPQLELLGLFSEISALNLVRAWESPAIRAEISTWDLIDRLDVVGSIKQVNLPLLLLYGASDAIVKPQQAWAVEAAMPANSRFRLLPRTSHLTLQLMPGTLRELSAWFTFNQNKEQRTKNKEEDAAL